MDSLTESDAETARELLRRGNELLRDQNVLSALLCADDAARLQPAMAEVLLRARCLAGIGRAADAMQAIERELALTPGSAEAMAVRAELAAYLARQLAEAAAPRKWETGLTKEIIRPVEAAAHRYTYRGHAMIKNPFDLALYPLLLWNLKPATIFEIGSYNGASALWMADTLSAFGVETHIHSLDVVKVRAIEHPRITFWEGSGRALEETFPATFFASCPRPFLVIDDADHTQETSIAVLKHFHPHLRAGEYVVVEDGLTADGPVLALQEFLPAHAQQYAIDPFYCDFFGYNLTWCVNGFLKRIA